ncbi:hypothetical protein [uncultured Cohaesibacter sp.]|uniref:hypothetical protein n=1 Tax=uncultured Cohaesibacter sp. TaxID=1002546 RepID=UPI002931B7B7|nr:hypothetical protein [uncultured Cohaesibacter sp.]
MSVTDYPTSSARSGAPSEPSVPPAAGPLAKREARLAWGLLTPTLLSVALVIVLPLIAIFWISAKPINLGDLRLTQPNVYERMRGKVQSAGDKVVIDYRLTNSSREKSIANVTMQDSWPAGLKPVALDPRCEIAEGRLFCQLGDWEAGYRDNLRIEVIAEESFVGADVNIRDTEPEMKGEASSDLFNLTFTWDNFRSVFDSGEFLEVLWVNPFLYHRRHDRGACGRHAGGLDAQQEFYRSGYLARIVSVSLCGTCDCGRLYLGDPA